MKSCFVKAVSLALAFSIGACDLVRGSNTDGADNLVDIDSPEAHTVVSQACLFDVPSDVITSIASFLPLENARSLSETNRKHNLAVSKNRAWKFLKFNNIHPEPGIPLVEVVNGKLALLDYMQAMKANDLIAARKFLENACALGDSKAIYIMFEALAHNRLGYPDSLASAKPFLEVWVARNHRRAIELKRNILCASGFGYEQNIDEADSINDRLIDMGSVEAVRFLRGHLKSGSAIYEQDLEGWKHYTEMLAELRDESALVDKLRAVTLGVDGYARDLEVAKLILTVLPSSGECLEQLWKLLSELKTSNPSLEKDTSIHLIIDWFIEKRVEDNIYNGRDAIIFKLRGLLFGINGYDRNLESAKLFLGNLAGNKSGSLNAEDSARRSGYSVGSLFNELAKEPASPARDEALRLINEWLIEMGKEEAIRVKFVGILLGENGYERNLEAARAALAMPLGNDLYGIWYDLTQRLATQETSEACKFVLESMIHQITDGDGSILCEAINAKISGLLFGKYGYERNFIEADKFARSYFDAMNYELKSQFTGKLKYKLRSLRAYEQKSENDKIIQLFSDWLLLLGDSDEIKFRIGGLLFGFDGYEQNVEKARQALDTIPASNRRYLISLLESFEEYRSVQKLENIIILRNWLLEKGGEEAVEVKYMGLLFGIHGYDKNMELLKEELAIYSGALDVIESIVSQLRWRMKTQEVPETIRLLNDWLVGRGHVPAVYQKIKGLLTGDIGYAKDLQGAQHFMDSIRFPCDSQPFVLWSHLDSWNRFQRAENIHERRIIIDWFSSKGNAGALRMKAQGLILADNDLEENIDEARQIMENLSWGQFSERQREWAHQREMEWMSYLKSALLEKPHTPERKEFIIFLHNWLAEHGDDHYKNQENNFKLLELLHGGIVYEKNYEDASAMLNSVPDGVSEIPYCNWNNESARDFEVAPVVMEWFVTKKRFWDARTGNGRGKELIQERFMSMIRNGDQQDPSRVIQFLRAYGRGIVDLRVLLDGVLAIPPNQQNADDLIRLIAERALQLNLNQAKIDDVFSPLVRYPNASSNQAAAYRLARIMGFVPKELL